MGTIERDLTPVPIDTQVVRQMKANRDKRNPSWSLAEYIEHITALDAEVLRRKEEAE